MKDLINWIEIDSTRGRGKLGDFQFSVYKNIKNKPSNSGNYITFSTFFSEIYKNTKKLRVGTIGNKIVFSLNNENGLNFIKNKSCNSNKIRVNSSELVKMILDKYDHNKISNSNTFNLKDLGNNTFIIE